MFSRLFNVALVFSMALLLSVPHIAFAEEETVVVEKPGALSMTGDLLIARPVMLGVTVVGAALYLVSLPWSLLGGNAIEAADTLVLKPAETTFIRCLGCKNPGYKRKVEKIEGEEE